MTRLLTTTILAATLAACATTGNDEAKAPPTFFDRNPYASTYVAYPSTPTLITNARPRPRMRGMGGSEVSGSNGAFTRRPLSH